jgi:hypothetical protein
MDYNQLVQLPLSFHKLKQLQVFRIEGNEALIDPPTEILTFGAQRVIAYVTQLYQDDKETRMRHIILATQNLLAQITERKLYDPAFFHANVHLPLGDDDDSIDKDEWYALQFSHIWDDLLPKMQAIWQNQLLIGIVEVGNQRQRNRVLDDTIHEFPFSQEEVLWAFTHYHDACGPIFRQQSAFFLHCACVSRVCIPPRVGYMCRRSALWLKKRLVRERDLSERKWSSYKETVEEDAVQRAEQEATLYLQSAKGKIWLEESAADQAEELLLEKEADKIVETRIQQNENKKQRTILQFHKKIIKLQKQRDKKLANLQKQIQVERDKLANYLKESSQSNLTNKSKSNTSNKSNKSNKASKQGDVAENSYYKAIIEQKIDQLAQQMAQLTETQELLS